MTLKLFGWLLIASSIVPLAVLIHQTRPWVSWRKRSGGDTYKVSFAKVGTLLGRLKRNDGTAGTLKVAAAAFLVVAGIGVARSYLGQPPEVTASEGAAADPLSPADEPDGDLAQLASYARSIDGEEPEPASETADGKLLPDVNTMIERLASRLASAPDDIQGWRMLGWSYVNTGRYDDATRAYAKAVALDPNSPEIARLYEEAKAKASGGDPSQAATPLQTGSVAVGAAGDAPHGNAIANPETKSEAAPPHETDAAIRSMVDGLADRLERSPRDVEGWTRLMRSRVVLGEKEIAATAFRKALEVFKDDSAASSQIAAMAIELGLKSE
ncbi:tetratricopeptide repeat protein [Hyphomicrobium sp.]|uniref:tetratricopeptide repeat protein n=1 Tax=Hyphomicrobium sp. TaxID=82 RepID=UPI003F70DBCE